MGRRYVMECSRVEMLKKIQCSNFAAYDMLLYLDTHSDDKKAFRMFQALVKKTKELKCEYEEKFGPLNQFSTILYYGLLYFKLLLLYVKYFIQLCHSDQAD